MWKLKAALALGLGAHLAPLAAAEALPLSPTATATAVAVLPGAAGFVGLAKESLSAELAVLDGGPLSQALEQAVRRGVKVRLMLDPGERSTRIQGRALEAAFSSVSPSVQSLEIRWYAGAGRGQRRVLLEEGRLLRWRAGEEPRRDDAGAEAFGHRFEKRWPTAQAGLPEGQALEDDLRSLPDPRERDPRIIRRREAAGE